LPERSPLFWPVAELVAAYRAGTLSPVEVAAEALDRIAAFDSQLHAYVTVTPEVALEQARDAERRYRAGEPTPPLLGVPTSIKDLFEMRGVPTSLGSLVYRDDIAEADSQIVAALRSGGATFLGKTNTAEFGQSATTENLLGLGCGNPWATARTAGGSSGGAAASVGAGLASVALGSDGGGSIRIPAALCGLVGVKPTYGSVPNASGFRAMTEFSCPGPIARTVADARVFMDVLWEGGAARQTAPRQKIAWCPRPQGRPVDPGVAAATRAAAQVLADLGHDVHEVDLPLEGWAEAFGPLVLADEWEHRRHLLDQDSDALTRYARRSIQAAERVSAADVQRARRHMAEFRVRVDALFAEYDLVVTPTTAAAAFPMGERPETIDGQTVDPLWGPFPFTAPFNVAGTPAVSLPCGLAEGLPVGLQIVGPIGSDVLLLDVCEELEAALGFPQADVAARWDVSSAGALRDGEISVERRGPIAIVRIDRPAKRNALSLDLLERLRAALADDVVREAAATVLTGSTDVFSAGADLSEVGRGVADLAMDEAVAAVVAAIRACPGPVLAAIEGPCMGAAVEVAAACDIAVAGASSSFALPATKLGILYRPAALRDLVTRLGYQAVARLILVGERVVADSALSAGIVGAVVPDGHALDAALELAAPAGGAVRRATASTKALMLAVEADDITLDLADWESERRDLLEARGRTRSQAAVDGSVQEENA
jgi:Asp-tRNA(Asn)/Glu-tRNA(Gln) amidotransferase A subunit family amidase/enoyl-CoA hydratase/carnithine racemase